MAATGLLKRAAQQVPSSPTFKLAFIRAHASEAQAQQVEPKAQDSTTLKTFQIYRWNPENPSKPELKDYQINLKECGPMVLDALIKIKNEIDPILTFCRSCHEGICGSCAMNINGCNGLACLTKIPSATTASTITSLLHMFVIKDLVVDMANFSSFNKSSALSGTIYSRSQKDCISQPTYSPPKYSEDFQLVSFSWNNSDSSTNTERGNRFYFFCDQENKAE